MEETAYIFIDEFGGSDTQYGKKGSEDLLVYAALVISSKEIDHARDLHKSILQKYFPAGFIKSNRIGNDEKGYAKTINALTDLEELPHYIYVLVVDKRRINSEGFEYKKSFVKFFQKNDF